jgi:quercetin dioxygenase-like cupin family protein
MTVAAREEIRIGSLAIRFLVESADAGGTAAVFEFDVPGNARVPIPHSHDAYEETIYGVRGVVSWTIAGTTVEIGPGDAVCIPRGVVHHFENRSDQDATSLAIVTPGALGPEYFRELAAVVDATAGGPPDPGELVEVMLKHGLTPAP